MPPSSVEVQLRFLLGALALSMTMWAVPVFAQSSDKMTAGLLSSACSPPSAMSDADREFAIQTCHSYLHGLTDGLALARTLGDKGYAACPPGAEPVSVEKAKELLKTWLASRPDTAGNAAGLVTAFAIIKAYPCGE